MDRRQVNSTAALWFSLYALWPARVAHALGLADLSNAEASQGLRTALERGVGKEDATIEQYVTRKSLDGLYFMIGEEEKSIRQNPAATGNALLSKVFGALR